TRNAVATHGPGRCPRRDPDRLRRRERYRCCKRGPVQSAPEDLADRRIYNVPGLPLSPQPFGSSSVAVLQSPASPLLNERTSEAPAIERSPPPVLHASSSMSAPSRSNKLTLSLVSPSEEPLHSKAHARPPLRSRSLLAQMSAVPFAG